MAGAFVGDPEEGLRRNDKPGKPDPNRKAVVGKRHRRTQRNEISPDTSQAGSKSSAPTVEGEGVAGR